MVCLGLLEGDCHPYQHTKKSESENDAGGPCKKGEAHLRCMSFPWGQNWVPAKAQNFFKNLEKINKDFLKNPFLGIYWLNTDNLLIESWKSFVLSCRFWHPVSLFCDS